MSPEAQLAIILLVLFLSSLVRSTFGFGDALIAMPLLAIASSLEIARPLVALVSVTIAVLILLSDWKLVIVRSAWRLIVSGAVGVPVGMLLLTKCDERLIKGGLAIFIIAFALYNLVRPRLPRLKSENLSYLCGFLSGALGGAFNTAGPPLIMYGAARRWSPTRFRATIQGVFLPVSLCIAAGHAFSGSVTPNVLWYFVASIPLLVLAMLMGNWLNRRIDQRRFVGFIHVFLLAIGGLLLINALGLG